MDIDMYTYGCDKNRNSNTNPIIEREPLQRKEIKTMSYSNLDAYLIKPD